MKRLSFCIVMGLCVYGCGIRAVEAVDTLNLGSTFDPLKTKMAAGQQGSIVVLGDSISVRDGSYLPVFTQLMQSAYGNAGPGYESISTGGGVAGVYSGSYDYGLANGDNAPYNGIDGLWTNLTSSGFGFIQPQSNSVTIQYAMQPGGGTVQFYQQATGSNVPVPVTTVSTNSATNQIGTFTFNSVVDNNTVYMHSEGDGPVLLLGMTPVTSGTGGVVINRAANGGWTTGDFLQRNWQFDGQLPLLNPDLVMIWLGQNDQNSYTSAQFAANLNLLIDRVLGDAPNSKILLVSNYSTMPASYSNAEEGVAASRGVGFIDFNQVPLDPADLVDGIHLSDQGGQYFGNMLFNAFQTDGASLAPEPGTLALVGLGVATLGVRRRRRTC